MLLRLIADIVSRVSMRSKQEARTAPSAEPAPQAPSPIASVPSAISAAQFNQEGQALADCGDMPGAAERYLAGINAHPGNAALRVNASNIFKSLGQTSMAREQLEQALELAPDLAGAWYNLGILLQETWWLEEALNAFERAFDLERLKGPSALCRTLFLSIGLVLQQSGQWKRSRIFLQEISETFPAFASEGDRVALFTWVEDDTCSPVDRLYAHTKWAKKHVDAMLPGVLNHGNLKDPNRPLNIGYVSGDFRAHAVSYFFEPLLRNHDRNAVRVICYDNTQNTDATTELLKGQAAEWRAISDLSDDALAQRVRDDAIDILIDLSGHTARNRLYAFALKPAPVQITWLGSRLTTGMAAMDYRISDHSVDPVGMAEHWHRERLLRVGGCQWCYGKPHQSPAVSQLPLLSNAHVTFGSFNQMDKLSGESLDAWAEIMRRLPESRLVMVGISHGRYREKLIAKWSALGVDARRLGLYGYVGREQFFDIHNGVDIGLDTFPYSGGTTTCESLWMGVPVVVMEGKSTLGRAGVSLLRAANLADWIAPDRDGYIRLALEKSADSASLAQLRAGMRERLLASPLMDGAAFARSFETALRSAWREWCIHGTQSSRYSG